MVSVEQLFNSPFVDSIAAAQLRAGITQGGWRYRGEWEVTGPGAVSAAGQGLGSLVLLPPRWVPHQTQLASLPDDLRCQAVLWTSCP